MLKKPISYKAAQFTESVIREMTRLAMEHQAINLSQGFPDFAAPEVLKKAAADAIFADVNQYAITWGAKNFRDAVVDKTKNYLGIDVDPEREITVSCGSTEAMIDVLLAVINPGDEVIVFEPFYENYGPDAIISGATPRYVQLRRPDWSFDEAELAAAFNNNTKAIIINTPNNPTGKVFSREELEIIAKLCQKWDVLAITDEIYEHILYDGAYYIMCDIGNWGYPNDVEFARFLVKDIGVATVPGSSFFRDPAAGKDIIRFTFCKKEETLRAAEERLAKLRTVEASAKA